MKRRYQFYLRFAVAITCISAFIPKADAAVVSGTYTIGAGGDYSDLLSAVSDLNSSIISGPVVFNIKPGSYSGSGWQAVITNIAGGSATNSVTIQAQDGPGSVSISVAGSSSKNYAIMLNSASYVRIKNLRITNTSTSYGRIIQFQGSSSNDSISGCVFSGATGSTSSTNRSIVYADNANGMANNVFVNDTIKNGSYGIYWSGSSTAGTHNHVFDRNQFVNNYYAYIHTEYIGAASIQDNTFNATGISGYHYGIYNDYPINGIKIRNNTIATTSTSGYIYGVYIYYGNYYSQSGPDLVVENNNIALNGKSYVYGINFDYRCHNMLVKGNTIVDQTTSSYNYGLRIYYYCTNLTCTNNSITTTNTTGSYSYPWYFYYLNYGNQTNGYANISNNVSNGNNNGSSGYVYSMYYYYCYNLQFHNNIINANSKRYINNYGPFYNAFKSKATNNTFNFINTGSGNTYNYAGNIYTSSTTTDTFENNTFNIQNTSSGSIYNYACYYIPTGSIARDNVYNISTKSGTAYNYSYYGNGGIIQNNKFNLSSTTGTVYGNYCYNYSSYSGANWIGNTFDLSSNSGTIYACGGYTPGQDKFISNVFVTKTSGATYLWYESSSYGSRTDQYFFNNTFHSNSTGSTDYLIYKAGGTSSSYPGKNIFYNNVFTSSNPSGTDGIYIRDTNKFIADYNLYYAENTAAINFYRVSPSLNTTDFNMWKTATQRDRNSLIYNPGYTNAANKDLTPSPLDPDSWAVQGRGIHLPGDTVDFNGNPRPKTRQQGVPDLGAYEFTPTATPPNCVATPANPVPNQIQVFTFGTDTVASIEWGSAAPTTVNMRQYTGLQAPPPMPAPVPRGYIHIVLNTSGGVLYNHVPKLYYKDAWLGDISNETNTKIARSTNNGTWEGYNFGNGITDSVSNKAYTAAPLDSTGAYTIVENARIGIRCVEVPTNVKVSNITAFTADVAWDPVFLPIGYQVMTDNNPGTPVSGTGALFTSTNTINVTALTENTAYYAHVRTICGAKDTSGWATVPFRTLITCHTPIVKITGLTQTRAIAYWDTIQTSTKYEYTITNSSTPVPAFGTATTNNSVYINIQAGKEYFVFVKAYCNDIYPESEWGMGSFMVFPTQVDNTALRGVNVSIYPNPVNDVLTLAVSQRSSNASAIITDLAGKIVHTQSISDEHTDIDVSKLAKGMYIIRYTTDRQSSILKFSKQ